jgi:preprotein translocase subunit SecD
MPNLFYTRVEQSNDATAAIEMGLDTPENRETAEGWPSFLPSGLVNLGLDLRGGAHLLAEVQVQEVYEARIEALWPDVRDVLRAERATVGTIRLQPSDTGELRVRISEQAGMPQALEAVRGLATPVVSLTGAGSTDLDISADGSDIVVTLSEAERQATDERTMQQALEIIRNRIDEVGTREPTIQRQGSDRILIQVPGIGSAQELKDIIGTTAQLTFQPVVGRTTNAGDVPGVGNELLPSLDEEGVFYILETAAVVTGEELVDAQPSFDQNGRPAVNFRFNPAGARKFGDYTAANIGNPFAIVLDNEVISAPVIQSHIPGGSGIITGNFTVEESTQLAVLLRAGALPAGMEFLEERTIGPELGQDSIDAGKVASLVGLALVVVFMVATYGLFGVFATVALGMNITLIFGVLSAIGGTLTLPGIAGIVLTIGMAVDANVLVFERIREELRSARGPARAIELGYEKALSAIIDANITTFIIAAILFTLGSGPVRGFAITLGLGILTSVFTSIFVTRLLIVMWFERARPREFRIKGLRLVRDDTNYNFFRWMRVTFGASVLAIVVSLVAWTTIGLNFGIDFRGGTTLRTESAQPIDVGAYRGALTPLGLGDVTITEVFDPTFGPDQNVAMIRIQAQDGDESVGAAVLANVEGALQTVAPDVKFTSVESVGPKVSGELIWTAIYSLSAAIAAILIYIWLRFEWQFAVGAVAALVHDVVLTIGIFALAGIRFDLTTIAALLTIVGYSINDTVVIFDRLRENLIKYRKTDLRELMNRTVNETLSRTLMTSGTTLLALFALLALGGDVIRGFVFAITWGIVVGTYSSVYVAKNIVLMLGVKRDWSKPTDTTGNQFGDVDA